MDEIYPRKYKKCPECVGKGRIRCPTCKGRREIIINLNAWHHMLNVPAEERMDCPNPKCSGRGSIECPICEGRGYVEREQRLKASNAELMSGVASRHDARNVEEVRRHIESVNASKRAKREAFIRDDFKQAKREALSSIDALLTHDSSDQTNTEKTAKGNSARISLPDLFSAPPPLGFQRDRTSLLLDLPSYNPTLDELCEDFERFNQEAPGLRMLSDSVLNREVSERRLANLMRALRAELSKIEFHTIGGEEKLKKLKSAVYGGNTPESVSSAIFHLWFQVAYAREVGVL
jgi:hypothetical protein